jgi:hypothetical protein
VASLGASPFARAATRPRIRVLTRGPAHHFFGYYGVSPWNRSLTKLVCLESQFQDHLPGPDEAALVGLVDAQGGRFMPLTETRAWNLQQGAMLSWNPRAPDREVIYNDRVDGRTMTTILDVRTRERRRVPGALAGLSPDGRLALGLSYGRLARLRPVVGYVGDEDPAPDDPHPDNDGVFLMNVVTGEKRLVVSIGETFRRLVKEHPALEGSRMFFNHTVFNGDGSRFLFLARASVAGKLESAMFTARPDGSDLRIAVPFGLGVSHFAWRNNTEILATFRMDGQMRHVLFTDGRTDWRVVGDGVLEGDGHCSFAPDGQRIVTDRNHADTLEKSLWVYDLRNRTGAKVATFPMFEKRFLGGNLRCDLHPRWSRTGRSVCVDALETSTRTRQLHVVDWPVGAL